MSPFSSAAVIAVSLLCVFWTCTSYGCFPSDLVQWTEVPALVKIYKLLINELSNQIEGTMAKEEELVEDSDDCDDEVSLSSLIY